MNIDSRVVRQAFTLVGADLTDGRALGAARDHEEVAPRRQHQRPALARVVGEVGEHEVALPGELAATLSLSKRW